MNKLKMAHDYAMAYIKEAFKDDLDYEWIHSMIAKEAWAYADAMQAEADKREDKTRPAVLSQGGYVEKPKYELAGVVAHGDDWQPDWSQAPRYDVVAWDINEHGQARWIASDNGYYLAPTFGYTGRWQDSLRKRPENGFKRYYGDSLECAR